MQPHDKPVIEKTTQHVIIILLWPTHLEQNKTKKR